MEGLTLNLLGLQLFTGVALGAVYVLLAIGLSLIFGMLTVVNFAHGAFYMLGAYVGLYLLSIGANFWVALVLVPLAVGVIGLGVERTLIRPLYGRGIDYPLLLTFGLSYVIVELVRIGFGKSGYPVDTPELLQGAVDIGVGYFPLYRLFVIGATAVILIALWLFLERTSFGLIIRAGARDPEIIRVLGVDVSRVWLIVFGIGTGIAGLAGLLAAPLQGVIPEMGGPILAEAFVVTVVGGMGSLLGAVARRAAGRRRREHHLAVRAGNGQSLDLRADGGGTADPAAGLFRSRRADELRRPLERDQARIRSAPLRRRRPPRLARPCRASPCPARLAVPACGAAGAAGDALVDQHPDLWALCARLQPAVRLSGAALLRPCRAVRRRRVFLRHRHRPLRRAVVCGYR